MKTFVSPEAISSDLVRKIRDLHRKILTLPEMMSTFSGKGDGAAAFLVPLVVQFSIHLYLSAPSKPGSRHLPSLKSSLSGPTLPGDPFPRASPPLPKDRHQTESPGRLVFHSSTAEAEPLLPLSSHCSQDTLPLGVPIGNNVTDLSVSASLRKLGASSGNRFR